MTRILSIFTLILMILLFPPATLALISNDAVPGDATYGIKRTLEAGVVLVASVSPNMEAGFSVERSQRRFKEVATLLNKDSSRSVQALDDLVSQTSEAASQVNNIEDQNKREELIQQLRQAISEYDKSLELSLKEAQQDLAASASPVPIPSPSPSPIPSPFPSPSPIPTPVPSPKPTPQPTPKPSPIPTPKPSPEPSPSPKVTPSPEVIPSPIPSPTPKPAVFPSIVPSNRPRPSPSIFVFTKPDNTSNAISNARDRLKEIERGLQNSR